MSSPIIAAIGCTIASWSSTIKPGVSGWSEHIRLIVQGSDTCEGLAITTANGSAVLSATGHASAAAGDHGLGPERLVLDGVDASGVGSWRVRTPELRTGDSARVDLVVSSDFAQDYTWKASPGVAYAELRRPRALDATASGLHADKRYFYAATPAPDAHVAIAHPWMTAASEPTPPPGNLSPEDARARMATIPVLATGYFGDTSVVGTDLFKLGVADPTGWAATLAALSEGGASPIAVGDARAATPAAVDAYGALPEVSATLTLAYTTTNPRAELRPDRPVTLHETRTLSWSESTTAHALSFAVSRDVIGPITSTDCRVRQVIGAVWVVAPPGVSSCAIEIPHAVDDAWGALPAELVDHVGSSFATWTGRDQVAHQEPLIIEGAAWRLPTLDGAPILSDRARLWQELRARFADASFPEPAIPLHAAPRGTKAWELVGMLPDVLRDQVVIRDDLATQPTHPRPLYKAREGGVVTSIEAAMIVTLYARQQKIDADWILVRPAALGPAVGATPVGFTTALVRVTIDGETRLLDPTCAACTPFTIRAELHGSDAIGDSVDRIP